MEMKIMIPSPAVEFNFDSACTSPYVSAPASPQRFGNYFFSAPTSPTRASAFFHHFSHVTAGDPASASVPPSVIPFNWEEKPGVPKRQDTNIINEDVVTDFAFDFSGQLERTSLSADELFDGGKIKPLKPPPRLQYCESRVGESSKSPKKMIKEALSPRHRKKDFDPFSEAIEQTGRRHTKQRPNGGRGREKTCNSTNPSVRHKGSRSLSPFRVSDMLFEPENNQQSSTQSPSSSSTVSTWASTWYKKWKLKDLLLFRSASEGHAPSQDPLKKYGLLKKNENEDVKNSSFRSADTSVGSVSSSRTRRKGPVSAHEMHYTVNRAVSKEMRKKTFLPYKQGLWGCLGFNFNSGGIHELSRGLGSSILTRQ